MTTESGLVVVDKPAGITSHDVVARVRRLAGTRKVGPRRHPRPDGDRRAGLGVERATRLLGHLMLTEKAYDATARLGVATVTDDAEGEVTATVSAAHLDEADGPGRLRGAGRRAIDQVPTAVSAIKVDGVRAYQRVRDGEDVALEPRRVTVHELTVTDVRRSRRADHGVSTSTSRCAAPAAPTCGRSPGTSAPRSGSAATSPRCGVPPSGPIGLDVAHTLDELADEFTVLPIADAARAAFPARDLDDAGRGRRARRPGARRRPRRADRAVRAGRRVPGALRAAGRRGPRRRRLRLSSPRLRPVQIWRSLDEVPADLGRTVVVIGNFDGVHLGHQHVLARAREVADEDGLAVVAVTFDPHPMAVLRPEHAPRAADHRRGARRAARREPGPTTCWRCRSTATWPAGARRSSSSGCSSTPCTPRPWSWARTSASAAAPPVTWRRCGASAREPASRSRAAPRRRPDGVVVDVRPPVPRRRRRGRRRRGARPPVRRPRGRGPRRPSAVASWASRPPTCPPTGSPRPPPTASTPAGCGGSTPARVPRPRSASAPTRRSTACATAGSRATCWTATTSSCTTSRSRCRSSSGCAAWSPSSPSTTLVAQMGDDVRRAREILAA